ncbi:MAG: ATP-binding protein, partial [Prevotella pleuritidis]|nr:ATP-binding protein [Hoylesella pleuritidis]
MQWTDRIHQIKILLVLGTVFVAVASLAVAHFLISDLEQEERKKMEVWAEAMNTLNNADEWT